MIKRKFDFPSRHRYLHNFTSHDLIQGNDMQRQQYPFGPGWNVRSRLCLRKVSGRKAGSLRQVSANKAWHSVHVFKLVLVSLAFSCAQCLAQTADENPKQVKPRLVALTWQKGDGQDKFSEIAWWKPDGELIGKQERALLQAEIGRTEVVQRRQNQPVPLIAIFELHDGLPPGTTGIRVRGELPNGDIAIHSMYQKRSAGLKSKDRVFAISGLFLAMRQDFVWPKKMDLNLEYHVESKQLIKKTKHHT